MTGAMVNMTGAIKNLLYTMDIIDHASLPVFGAGKSTIDLSLFVTDVLAVDDSNFSLTLYAYLGVRWLEPRLEIDLEGGFWAEDDEAEIERRLERGVDVEPEVLRYSRVF